MAQTLQIEEITTMPHQHFRLMACTIHVGVRHQHIGRN